MKKHIVDVGPYTLEMFQTKRFRTISIDIHFFNSLKKEDITYREMLNIVLSRSCAKYPTRQSLALKTAQLYNPVIRFSSARRGKSVGSVFHAMFLNPEFTDNKIWDETMQFIFEVMFNPLIDDNGFTEKEFNKAKFILENRILSIKDNPSLLALTKALESYDINSPVAYSPNGDLEILKKMTRFDLYNYYKNMICHDMVNIEIIGDFEFHKMNQIIRKYCPINTIKKMKPTFDIKQIKNKNRLVQKELIDDFTQAKLVIIAQLLDLNSFEANYVLYIFNYLFGSQPSSKLFQIVREQNSLAYSIYSTYRLNDNLLFVLAGIDQKKL